MFECARFAWPCTNCSKRGLGMWSGKWRRGGAEKLMCCPLSRLSEWFHKMGTVGLHSVFPGLEEAKHQWAWQLQGAIGLFSRMAKGHFDFGSHI